MRVPNAQLFLHIFSIAVWLDVRRNRSRSTKEIATIDFGTNVNEGRKNCQTDRTELMVRESNIGTCEVTDGFC